MVVPVEEKLHSDELRIEDEDFIATFDGRRWMVSRNWIEGPPVLK